MYVLLSLKIYNKCGGDGFFKGEIIWQVRGAIFFRTKLIMDSKSKHAPEHSVKVQALESTNR